MDQPLLYCDNQTALDIFANPVCHKRTKHRELGFHFVREKIQDGVVKTFHISKHQRADLFAATWTTTISHLIVQDVH